jgi:F0F1-type ATP synthase epsilon subunit
MMELFKAKIVSPSGIVFEGNVWQISACNSSGAFAVRAGHAAMFTQLADGNVEMAVKPDERKKIEVNSAVFEFFDNTCSIMCEKNY